ncbi:MAG TPA: carbon starvation CstA family protein [Candidatus Kapabacteria bacterium]|nr:carbon starvation CstA family protein [Candidatus Kapabacteria bacterium]
MSLPILGLLFIVLLALAYRLYGRWVEKQFEVNNAHATPAHTRQDGVDYVPTRPFYLFGQHFSAIAAAGPIAGPILACQAWGWLPCLLWIGLGVVFIGAVHDFSSLAASVRHGGHSIAEITGKHLGKRAGIGMMVFIWIALLYVIVAFTDITAASFVHKTEELAGANVSFNPGGAVAAAAIFYLILSIIMGLVERYLKPKLWLSTLIFVPLTFVMVWLGTQYSTLFILDPITWGLLILAYCFVASLIPVWALLQPRGYLGGFILYTALALGIIGLFFGGFEVQQPAVKSWDIGGMTGSMFPFLFVTIACGACSGFHGLVCSGTTSKQIDKEKHMHSVGYGAMLAEGFVALIALVTIMIMTSDEIKGLKPGTIYGNGIGSFLTMIIGEENRNFAITFGAMAFSTFVFDTLDVSTRLGRYLLQELLGWKGKLGAMAATLATIGVPAYFIGASVEGSWVKYWTLFGASNQLLAALTLLSITVWLYQARKRIAFTLLPMLFVLVITMYSLISLVIGNFKSAIGFDAAMINALFSLTLILLALYLAVTALMKVKAERTSTLTPELAT